MPNREQAKMTKSGVLNVDFDFRKRVKQKDPLNPCGFKGSNIVVIQPLEVVSRVVGEGVEPPTRGFSVLCSTN